MALSLPAGPASAPRVFDRHVKRLAWCALLGSMALLVPQAPTSSIDNSVIQAIGAGIIVIAVLCLVRDVASYIRQEAARRQQVARESAQAAACRAADTIQDRVANLLSVTVGYTDFLATDDRLSAEAHDQAQRALDSALAAARVVSTFRQSLGCEGSPGSDRPQLGLVGTASPVRRDVADPDQRSARVLAEAPVVLDVLADAQHLAISLLAGPPRTHAEEGRIRAVLERINEVTARIEA